MCAGRVNGGTGSSDSISTSFSGRESGESGVGPESGSWISMSELRRIIVDSRDAVYAVQGVQLKGGGAGY